MKTNTPAVSGLEPLLTIEELAEYLDVPVATIYDWRVDGKGPCVIRIGRRVKFAICDVKAWIDGQRESSPGHQSHGPRSSALQLKTLVFNTPFPHTCWLPGLVPLAVDERV
jgi:excisionase family DNA binding protein